MKPAYGPLFGAGIFSTLIRFDALKVDNTDAANLVPELAERWDIAKDGLSITFYLRKGVTWHDGKPFTADDVVYSLDKMADPKRSLIAVNFSAYANCAKIDDYSVKINLKQISNSFFKTLGIAYAVIQPKHLSGVDNRTAAFIVGTGPFMYKASTSGVSFEMVKNPNYFEKGLPYLDGVLINVVSDRTAQMDAFATNRVDMTAATGGIVNQEQYDRIVQNTQGKNIQFQEQRVPYGTATWFGLKQKELQDPRVRYAMNLVVFREEFNIGSFGQTAQDWNDFNHYFMPTGWGLSKDEIYKLSGWNQTKDERIAAAKKLMVEAGYPSGFDLKLPTGPTPESGRTASLYAETWKKYLGINATLNPMDFALMLQARAKGDFGAFVGVEIQPLCADPDEFTSYLTTGSPYNFCSYSNPEFDRLNKLQTVETDPAKRKAIVQDMERLLIKEGVVSAGGFTVMRYAAWPYVKNYVVQSSFYGPSVAYKHIWLDK
jgi:peptide/nickel transport system substrate-binding protein